MLERLHVADRRVVLCRVSAMCMEHAVSCCLVEGSMLQHSTEAALNDVLRC